MLSTFSYFRTQGTISLIAGCTCIILTTAIFTVVLIYTRNATAQEIYIPCFQRKGGCTVAEQACDQLTENEIVNDLYTCYSEKGYNDVQVCLQTTSYHRDFDKIQGLEGYKKQGEAWDHCLARSQKPSEISCIRAAQAMSTTTLAQCDDPKRILKFKRTVVAIGLLPY